MTPQINIDYFDSQINSDGNFSDRQWR